MPIVQSIADHSLNKIPESSLELFPESDHKAEPFPIHCYPPIIREMVEAISKAERTPESLASVCIEATGCASIGKGHQLKSWPGTITMANAFYVASADSGSGKSRVFHHALQPFLIFEKLVQENWKKKEKPKLQAEKYILEEGIKKLRKQIQKFGGVSEQDQISLDLEKKCLDLDTVEDKLKPPTYSVEDITSEKMAVIMESGDETLASLSADAHQAVSNLLGRYLKDGTDDGLYVKAYSGDMCKVHRIGRDPVALDEPCLTILWLTQPDKLESLLAKPSLTEGGLIPRLDICHTNAKPQKIINDGYSIPDRVSYKYRELIHDLMVTSRRAKEPNIMESTPEILERMTQYQHQIVDRLESDLKDIKSIASRWAEKAWRRAILLHAFTHGEEAHKNDLSLDTVEKAIAITEWFANEQLDMLSAGRESAWLKMKDNVLTLLDENPNGIKGWDVSRKRFTRFAQEGEEVLKKMEAEGILISREKRSEGGGPISRIYTCA